MGNPLMSLLGNQQPQPPQNNFFGFVQQFNQFKQSFKGDPKQQVQELLNSGKMTQEQLDHYTNMAQSIQNLFH